MSDQPKLPKKPERAPHRIAQVILQILVTANLVIIGWLVFQLDGMLTHADRLAKQEAEQQTQTAAGRASIQLSEAAAEEHKLGIQLREVQRKKDEALKQLNNQGQ